MMSICVKNSWCGNWDDLLSTFLAKIPWNQSIWNFLILHFTMCHEDFTWKYSRKIREINCLAENYLVKTSISRFFLIKKVMYKNFINQNSKKKFREISLPVNKLEMCFHESQDSSSYWFFIYIGHRVEKFSIFLSLRFYEKSILENIELKSCHFLQFCLGSQFCLFGEFQPSKSAKMLRNQISELTNLLKW